MRNDIINIVRLYVIKHARIFTKLLPEISRLISTLKIPSPINVEEIQVFRAHILSSSYIV